MAAVNCYDSWVENDDSLVENNDSLVENDNSWVENGRAPATCEVAPLTMSSRKSHMLKAENASPDKHSVIGGRLGNWIHCPLQHIHSELECYTVTVV